MSSSASDRGETLGAGLLAGITVLDLADQKGAYCTKLFADVGANVIKVEPPGGDPTRNIGPFYHGERHPEKSLYFFQFNTNKRSVTLDLNTVEGRDRFKELVQTADVLVETDPPGYLDGLGLGYLTLKELNPALIMTSITSFGQTGPWKDYKSSDLVALATGGVLAESGWPDLPPQRLACSQAYYLSSVQAAAGTLMALFHRLATRAGQHVDVSLQQSVPVCMQASTVMYRNTGKVRGREGNERKQPAQGVFPCKDGYVDIGQLSSLAWWDRFVDWLEGEGAAADLKEARWKDPFYRTRPETIEHVNRVLEAFFSQHTKEEIFHRGQRCGVVIGPVNTPQDIAGDAHLRERGFFVPVTHPELGATPTYLGAPYRLAENPWRISRRPPLIGEHNQEILGKLKDSSRQRPVPAAAARLASTRPGNPTAEKRLPLQGIRVTEFTEQIAGPMAGKALADYGAQVVLVENEERARTGSSSRHPATGASSLTSLNVGSHFNKFNTNKLSLTLDLKHPRGMEIARRLIRGSDVVISNFVPRVLDRWGFSYAALQEIKPDIIFLTMPAFDTEGPYAAYRTLSWNLMAMCGLDYASGFPGRPPIRANAHSFPDTSSQPFHALIAVLAALYRKARTGKGEHIEVCQYESTLGFTETLVFEYLVNGQMAKPMGNHLPYAAPHGVYRCQGNDRWCTIAVFTDEEWQAFCRAIERADLLEDERFNSLEKRLGRAGELDEIVNRWTEKRSDWEVMELLQKAGVAAGVVENVADLLDRDPQLKARDHWIYVDHPEAGKLVVEDWGFRLSAAPPLEWRRAPLLGEHNDFVLTQILGLAETEVNQLIVEGVIR